MVNIFIEAKDAKTAESCFLKALLEHIGIVPKKYDIIYTGGYKNLLDSDKTPFVNKLKTNSDVGVKNLVVFDADTSDNNGGFGIRKGELMSCKEKLGVEFDLFLWPDNKSDGDVEVLMERIARKDLYPEFFDCFGKYERCISQRKNENGKPYYTTPNRKGKLNTFFTSLPVSNNKKRKQGSGDWDWNNADIWNLDSESLNPIKDFLLFNLK